MVAVEPRSESAEPADATTPAVASDWLLRPQLLALLDKAGHYKLTSLQAPAGSGKTTLLTQWQCHLQGRALIAWLKLEPSHNDPVRFFSRLISAVRRAYASFDAYYLNQLADDVEFSVDAISESLRQGFAALPGELYVLIDDYQFISAPAIHQTLADVLHYLPHQVHFVIASRSHPPLQLSRLKLEDELLLVDIHDLRWEQGEIGALARRMHGADMNSEDLSQLAQVTEGWIAGIKLMLLSPGRSGRQPLHSPVNVNHPEVIQYLADAVLQQQSPELQVFLLQTSVLETLSADLCNRLLDICNAQQHLDYLLANQLFIQSADGERPGYRYHSLFREFLQHRLQVEYPDGIAALHRRAAHWFVERHEFARGLEMLRAINDRDAMQDVLTRCADEWIKQGQLDSLIEWVNQLPETLVMQQSDIAFPFIAALVFSRRFNQAHYFFTEISKQLQLGQLQGRYADGDSLQFLASLLELFQRDTEFVSNPLYKTDSSLTRHHDLRLFFLAMRAYHFLLNAQYAQATVEAQRAKDLLRQTGHEYLGSFADLILVLTERAQGRMLMAVYLAEQAFRDCSSAENTPAWANAATSIAVIRYEQNRVDDAEKMFLQLIPRVSSACATEVIAVNYCMLARIRFMQGHEREARRLLDYLSRVLQHGNYERFASQTALELVLHAFACEDRLLLERVQREFRLKERRAEGLWARQPDYDEGREKLGIAQALILQMQGGFEAAEAILTDLCRVTLAQGCVFRWAVCRANLAMLYWRQQQEAKALQVLQATLRESHLVCFNRTLFDEAPGAASLLQRALDSGTIKPLPSLYLEMFGDLLNGQAAANADTPLLLKPEPLTDKEMEILLLLQAGFSNKEVSRRARISLATAKWHLKNIYAKLAVSNRTEAVTRARQLHLL